MTDEQAPFVLSLWKHICPEPFDKLRANGGMLFRANGVTRSL